MEALAIEFCAFTVAISVEWHPWSVENSRIQWCPNQLSSEIAAGQYGNNVNCNVQPEALHQGLFLFKKVLRAMRHEVILMAGRKETMNILSFMDLPERSKGLNIIFIWEHRYPTSLDALLSRILNTTNKLLTGCGYSESSYRSLGELCGALWLRGEREKLLDENTTVNKRRKSAHELGDKMLSIYGKQINEFVTNNLCINETDSSELYLAAALKASNRDLTILNSVAREIFPSDIDDDAYLSVMNDQRVKDSISLYPKRNITFSSVEKELVLCLLDVIKEVITEKEGDNAHQLDSRAAVMTKQALSNHPIYSELVTTSIERWYSSRDTVLQTRGRKVYKDFEAEVWGKLMLHEFETVMVRLHYIAF